MKKTVPTRLIIQYILLRAQSLNGRNREGHERIRELWYNTEPKLRQAHVARTLLGLARTWAVRLTTY